MNEYTAMQQIQINYLNLVTNDQLIKLFKQQWKYSTRSFAKYYNINPGNFSSFLEGKKDSKVSIKSIKDYFTRIYVEGEEKINKEIESMSKDGTHKVYVNPRALIDKLVTLTRNKKAKSIFFINADNDTGIIAKNFIIENIQNIHYIFFVSKGSIISSYQKELNKSCISVCRAGTTGKNAADVLLSVMNGTLDMMLDFSVSFFLFCNRDYIKELKIGSDELVPKRLHQIAKINEISDCIELYNIYSNK